MSASRGQKLARQADRFFHALWGEKESGLILLWHGERKSSHWLEDPTAAAELAVRLERDVYTGIGLSPEDFGPRRRCPANLVLSVPGLWADIDIAGPAHKKSNLPPTEEAARELIAATGLRPTLLVHSGHGLQAWWLTKEIIEFGDTESRQRFKEVAALWQRYLTEAARQQGWVIDSVGDLARLLRVPGSVNGKVPEVPVPVRLLIDDGPRYEDLAEFEERVAPLSRSVPGADLSAENLDFGDLHQDREPPEDLIESLCENGTGFRDLWEHWRPDLPSQSEYELAIAGCLVREGCSNRVIVDALIAHRRRWEPTTIRKALRPDYLQRTIRAARDRDEPDDNGGDAVKAVSASAGWPQKPDDAAFYGLAGDFVRAVEEHTEADPIALLTGFHAAFGNCVGRSPHFIVERDRHYPNIYVVQVGESSKGRKGTAHGYIRDLFRRVDPEWVGNRLQSGLSSGEGLIWEVRDEILKRDKQGNGSYEDVVVDPGVADKRLLIVEPEFATVLKRSSQQVNTLSAILRLGWDLGDLNTMVKTAKAKATGAHISLIGHITKDELRRYLNETEAANGFGNRHLFICIRRSKCLPEGGNLEESALEEIVERLKVAVDSARRITRMVRDDEARAEWAAVYPELSEGKPGLFGSVTSRAEAQVLRLSMLYALEDSSAVIQVEHQRAALAVWEYAEDSARHIFGRSLGDPTADDILQALGKSPHGLSRTGIRDLFGRHRSAAEIGRALGVLLKLGLIERIEKTTGGRTALIWRLKCRARH